MSTSRRPDASMTLLREVMEAPLDPGYAQAAARRSRDGERSRMWSQVLVLLLAVAMGLGSVWAARELREPVPGMSARTVLVAEIKERTQIGAELAAGNAALRTEVAQLQQQSLGAQAQSMQSEANALGIVAGTTPVVGPGIVIELSDSARASAGEPGTEDERVKDVDLQFVVNSLWSSGAESIAINGVRLSTSSAIRSAGQSVLVDLQALVSPYRIEVVGDPGGLRDTFAQTQGAAYLADLSSRYGIRSELTLADELSLPAGSMPVLENVSVITN